MYLWNVGSMVGVGFLIKAQYMFVQFVFVQIA